MNHKSKSTVCLNMIVKNEAHVIQRCLNSLKDIIDYWVIVDTGSTDGTQEVIQELMTGIPGELHERPWVDFATNRNQALELAKPKADFTLIMDADDVIDLAEDFEWSRLKDQAGFMFEISSAGVLYLRYQLINNQYDWAYKGVLHEYLECPGHEPNEIYPDITILIHTDGARSLQAGKYERDVKVLKQALKNEPENDRYTFYLAQSYRGAGDIKKAIKYYKKRAHMGGWYQEVFYSLYQVAELKRALGKPWPKLLEAYLQAYESNPDRAEPLYAILGYYKHTKNFHTAFVFARAAKEKPFDRHQLFVEPQLYEWKIPLEYAVCCYELGLHHEAVRVYDQLLSDPDLTEAQRQRATENRAWSASHLS